MKRKFALQDAVKFPWFYLRWLLILVVLLGVTTPTPTQSAPLAQSPGAQIGGPIYLHLAQQSFDPLTQDLAAQAPMGLWLQSYAGDGSGYYIVQFDSVVWQEYKAQLEAFGVILHGYIPDYAFVVRMNSAIAERVQRLPHVRWVGLYQPSYRIDPNLLSSHVSSGRTDSIQLIVSTFPGEDIQPVVQQFQAWGGQVIAAASDSQWEGRIKVEISAAHITDIANSQSVEWIEPAREMVLHNNVAADIMGVRPVWNNHGLYGSNQVVGICDTGLDRGSILPANLHNDFLDGAGNSRAITITDIAGDGVRADIRSGHGSHVAGSVLGNGLMSGSLPLLHSYPTTAPVGMAPEARLYFQACGNNSDGIVVPMPISNLFSPAYAAGARVHTNSWGSSAASSYDSMSQGVDQFMWDNKDMAVLFSAGNSGVDADANGVIDLYSIGSPATAKNNVTVGASESVRPPWPAGGTGYDFNWATGSWATKYPAAPVSTDHVSNNSGGMAAFSSRGPTLDGRLKPDIVAPGTNILSVRSYSATTGLWGNLNADYAWSGGTSMSTPLVAGAAALAREFFTRTHTFEASSALIKATLINGAAEMAPGQYGTGATREITPTRPNSQEGWGRVNLEASLFPASPRRTLYWDTSSVYTSSLNQLSTGQVAMYTFQVTQSLPLSVTLAWTDYPGTLATNGALVNDLDLQATGPTGTTFYPNNANHSGPILSLIYDDNAPAWVYNMNTNERAAVRFTPTSYPFTLTQGVLYGYAPAYPTSFRLKVWRDDGPGGQPGTNVFTATAQVFGQGWLAVPISGVTISSGSFYIGMEITTNGTPRPISDAGSTNARSWYYNGTTWQTWASYTGFDRDVMIRAIGKGPDYATQADRVNNVEGIDIPSPATGVYTVTVSGYNVPQGPQPYALVVSGVGRPLGSETLTRTIPGAGTYKFGNTGAALRFTSENLNEVGVTVYRDKFPTSLPADQSLSIKRYYVITSTGGTGAFNADLTLSYEQDQVGAINEGNLGLYRWRGPGLGWQAYPATADANANIITATGVTTFSYWAIAVPAGPTDVTLTSATAQSHPFDLWGWLLVLGVAGPIVLGLRIIRRRQAK